MSRYAAVVPYHLTVCCLSVYVVTRWSLKHSKSSYDVYRAIVFIVPYYCGKMYGRSGKIQICAA